jgi:hypothetical protein
LEVESVQRAKIVVSAERRCRMQSAIRHRHDLVRILRS